MLKCSAYSRCGQRYWCLNSEEQWEWHRTVSVKCECSMGESCDKRGLEIPSHQLGTTFNVRF